jgi:hypothetical protein
MSILSKIFKKKSNTNKASLILDEKGINSIGGKASSEIDIPELKTSPIVYFGCISKNETHFPKIDFDLHLVCPIFIDLQSPVFFDYSNPKKPKLIRDNVTSNFNQLFEDIPSDAYIEYKRLNFKIENAPTVKIKTGVHEFDMVPGEIGHTILPNWIHDEEWLICPITGNKMEFLFQLEDIDDSETVKGQEILDKEYIDPYLHFGHGYLYVFYEPESKVIGYLNQL